MIFFKKILALMSGKSWYFPAAIIVFLLILLCLCSIVSEVGESSSPQSQISHTDVAATIYEEMDIRTEIAATIFADIPTPEPTCTPIPAETPDPYADLFAQYPCLPQDTEKYYAKVVEVVDGDTIKVEINGSIYSLRYIGIDCPECKDPSRPVELFSQESTEKNQQFVEGNEVLLVKDVSEVDKYNRLLRYVFVDSTFVNYELVKEGFAHASTYPPDVACSDFFADAQNQASVFQLGFWSPSYAVGTELGIIDQPETPTNPREGCDPSYPTVCIPPYPPDLDCGEISYRRFKVTGSDRHGFDGDNDGIGCES